MNCVQCNKETKNPRFCSRSCNAIYNNKLPGRKRLTTTKKCQKCDNLALSSKVKYCLEHQSFYRSHQEYKSKTLGEYQRMLSVKGKHPSWLNAHVRNFNRVWNKKMIQLPCASCGYDKHVELCHKKSISSFPEDTLLGEVNHPSNILQLCRNCHWEYDNHLLEI